MVLLLIITSCLWTLCFLFELYQLYRLNQQMKKAISIYSLLSDKDIQTEASKLEDMIAFLHTGDTFDSEVKIERAQMMSVFYEDQDIYGEGSIASKLTKSTANGSAGRK